MSEYGYVFAQGITHADAVIAHIEEPKSSVPESARAILTVLVGTFQALEAQIQVLDAEIIHAPTPMRHPDMMRGDKSCPAIAGRTWRDATRTPVPRRCRCRGR